MKNTLKTIALIAVMAAAVVFATVSGGKWGMKEIVYTITLPLALVVSCKNDPETTINKLPTAIAEVNGGTLANGKYEFDFTQADKRTITLKGSGADTDGTIASYAWTCTKKPDNAANPTFNATAQNPVVSGFDKLGDYEFTLKVKDNDGAESAASVVKVALYRTTTAEITIPERTFEVDTKLDFSVNYGDIDPYFAGRITYKINDGTDIIADTAENPAFSGNIFSENDYYDGRTTVFTQVFYFDGNKITPEKSRSVEVVTCGTIFSYFLGDNASEDYMSATTPELNILFSKKVTEGNVQ